MIRTIVVVFGALVGATGAGAQSFGNPGGLSPDTPGMESGSPAPNHSNVQDKLFVRQASIGGRAEVESGQLAQKKANTAPVRDFAKRMVDEHSKSNDRLLQVGRKTNQQLAKDLDPEHKAVRAELEKTTGADFDRAYIGAQIQNHQRTANLLLWHISSGQNEALRKYSMDSLPVVLDHLEAAQRQLAMLTSSPAPAQ